ncbi:MAG: phosphate starvation-inducible protein PhoH [Legionellales bacterium]|nr:phosphate starvation-inducible protein PhoH [Legionellales bacterium]
MKSHPDTPKGLHTTQVLLSPEDNHVLQSLCGELEANLTQIETQLSVNIQHRGHEFTLSGAEENVLLAREGLLDLYQQAADSVIEAKDIYATTQNYRTRQIATRGTVTVKTRIGQISGRTDNQRLYMDRIVRHHLNFGIGPAGTGKTFLAVALAVAALEAQSVEKIILVRPAVEAGERLGFLPGDLSQKIDPYLRPLYDALYDMLGVEKVEKLLASHKIELAPLAYMRGRTLTRAMILLDESQNTTREQMKMFLTRIGFGSKAIVTGDLTQVDLPGKTPSGLLHACEVLKGIPDISFTFFEAQDVVRHPLVQQIIEAYEQKEGKNGDHR